MSVLRLTHVLAAVLLVLLAVPSRGAAQAQDSTPSPWTGSLDLGLVARRHGLKQTGLRNLTGIFLGTRIPKGTKTTNWAARQLTAQQVTYAATDAWACRELYLRFRELGLL